MPKLLITLLAILSFTQISKSQTLTTTQNTLYVTPYGSGNGSSFESASNLADALKWANNNKSLFSASNPLKIFISGGTHLPKYKGSDLNASSGRDATFKMVANVQLYGGFVPANYAYLSDKTLEIKNFRNIEGSPTILSGDRNSDDNFSGSGNAMVFGNYGDNVNHIMVATNELGVASIDGVIFQGGYAKDGNGVTVEGQGLNQGYGAAIYLDNSNLEIRNSIFRRNHANNRGAAIYAEQNSRLTLYNCLFYKNSANEGNADGGAIHLRHSDGKPSSANLYNCTISNNHANDGGAIYVHGSGSVANFYNSIVYGNTAKNGGKENFGTENSGAYHLHNSSTSNPLFVNSNSDNYKLQATSSAINAGNSSIIPQTANYLFDVIGAQRKYSSIDLGAYENEITINITNRKIYAKPSGKGDGTSWDNATNLADALKWANANKENTTSAWSWTAQQPLEIWTTKGYYSSNSTSFSIANNVKLVGHFNGNETTISQRVLPTDYNFQSNINGNNNTRHLVKIEDADGLVEIDGFKISNARAADPGANQFSVTLRAGGALINNSNVLFKNVNFSDNYAFSAGAGVYAQSSNIKYQNAAFINNRTASTFEGHQGGGIFHYGGDLEIDRSYFTRNYTSVGLGVYFNGSNNSLKVTNSNFSHNHGYLLGGAIAVASSNNTSIDIINTLFNDNKIYNGLAIHSYSSTAINLFNCTIVNHNPTQSSGGSLFIGSYNLKNTIVFNNRSSTGNILSVNGTSVGHSLIEDSFDENGTWKSNSNTNLGGNVNSYGLTMAAIFNDPANNDFTLRNNSKALNKGDNSIYNVGNSPEIHDVTTDLAGNTRIYGDVVDIGAYENQVVLPITLKDFTVAKINSGVKLTWSTLSEQNNKEFVVYRSIDGINFIEVAKIEGLGNSTSLKSYSYIDYKPANGINYYQLKQIDFDGTASDLGIKFVNFSISNPKISIYPNPTDAVTNVEFEANQFTKANLVDISGKTLQTAYINSSSVSVSFDLTRLPKGVYFVQLSGKQNAIVKLIKK